MEEQYGEHYAQKVEDRLGHYLHELGTVLPGDTYIDKVCVLWRCVILSAVLAAQLKSKDAIVVLKCTLEIFLTSRLHLAFLQM